MEQRVVKPGKRKREVISEDGRVIVVPPSWELLPPGDATLTRRVKKGPYFLIQETKGRRNISKGIWAPGATIRSERARLDAERETPAYRKRLEAGRARRKKAEETYGVEFVRAIERFLAFPPSHHALARGLATAVAEHATPVGSGTVARTKRIPVEERARAAVIAWMRHQTTDYDDMRIARVKGERRKVRRGLAKESVALLARYRKGEAIPGCPLSEALDRWKERSR